MWGGELCDEQKHLFCLPGLGLLIYNIFNDSDHGKARQTLIADRQTSTPITGPRPHIVKRALACKLYLQYIS